jgi:hypothetical protein
MLDFPSSPTTGQQYPAPPVAGIPTYTWDGEKWSTAASSGGGNKVIVADTAPTGVPDNTLWWESDSGLLYVLYNDGDTTQWVLAVPVSGMDISALALKDSPIFTGNPTAPTPPAGDNDTSIATTAFVSAYAAPLDALAYSGLQVNGAMEISQERGTTQITIPPPGYVADHWFCGGTPTVNCNVSASMVPGLPNSIAGLTATPIASLAAGDYWYVSQKIEGYRCARLAWGTANARPITICFWSAHHRPGLYTVAVQNGQSPTRAYCCTYTHVAADVAQYNVVTVPGDTTGTWKSDNSVGLFVLFTMASGSNYIAPLANTWYSANDIAAPGQVNAMAATSDVWRLTGIMVLPGSVAPSSTRAPSILRPYAQELITCQRYFYNGVPPARGIATGGTTVGRMACPHPVSMRVAPTLTIVASLPVWDGVTTTTVTGVNTNYCTTTAFEADFTTAAALATWRPALFYQGAGGNIVVDARL